MTFGHRRDPTPGTGPFESPAAHWSPKEQVIAIPDHKDHPARPQMKALVRSFSLGCARMSFHQSKLAPSGKRSTKSPAGISVGAADRARARQLLDELTMVVTSAPEPELRAAWDDLVARTAGTDVAQLSGWAALRKQAGYQPLYLLATSGPWLLGGGLVLRRKVRGVGRVGYLPYGPVLSEDLVITRPVVRHQLVEALSSVARSHAALFVQPPDGGDDIALELLQKGFRFSQAGIAPAARHADRPDPDRGRAARQPQPQAAHLDKAVAAARRSRSGSAASGTSRCCPRPSRPRGSRVSARSRRATSGTIYHGRGRARRAADQRADCNSRVAAKLITGVGGVLKKPGSPGWIAMSPQDTSKLNVASAVLEAISWGRANGYRAFDWRAAPGIGRSAARRPG